MLFTSEKEAAHLAPLLFLKCAGRSRDSFKPLLPKGGVREDYQYKQTRACTSFESRLPLRRVDWICGKGHLPFIFSPLLLLVVFTNFN